MVAGIMKLSAAGADMCVCVLFARHRCFWINLPFGAVGLLAVLFIFKVPPSTNRSSLSIWQKLARIDLVGAFFLIPGIICLLLALQWGGTTYPWSNSKVWGCLLGFALIIAVFVVLQIRRGDE